MKRNSPHTNKKNKPSTTKNPAQPDSVSQTTCSCKIYIWHLKFCTFMDKMLEISMRVLKKALWKAFWIPSSKKCKVQNVCMCMSVFLRKHAECYTTFVSGTDFSLAFGLAVCKCSLLFYQPLCFVGVVCLYVLYCCKLSDTAMILPEC